MEKRFYLYLKCECDYLIGLNAVLPWSNELWGWIREQENQQVAARIFYSGQKDINSN